MTPSTPTNTPEPAEKQTTTYIVFRQFDPQVLADVIATLADDDDVRLPETPLFEQLPGEHTVTAGQSKLAIKAATQDLPVEQKNGNFVAVSARSWKPIPRKVATREVDDWG